MDDFEQHGKNCVYAADDAADEEAFAELQPVLRSFGSSSHRRIVDVPGRNTERRRRCDKQQRASLLDEMENERKAVFGSMDTNNDNQISRDEFLARFCVQPRPPQLESPK